jgi:hypothetical protein
MGTFSSCYQTSLKMKTDINHRMLTHLVALKELPCTGPALPQPFTPMRRPPMMSAVVQESARRTPGDFL